MRRWRWRAGWPVRRRCRRARIPATGETVVLEARATLDGDRVDVWVLAADGTERVVAIDTTCEVVVDRPQSTERPRAGRADGPSAADPRP